MNSGPMIDYDALQQDAMRGLVRTVLGEVAKSGLPGDHHFYISFNTRAPGVGLSRRLKEKYPREMTIVLQHRFWGLAVSEDRFEVNLTFDGIPERLIIPFQSLLVFFDPSVRFGHQLESADIGPDPRNIPPAQSEAGGAAATTAASRANANGAASTQAAARPVTQRKPRPQKKPRTSEPAEKEMAPVAADGETAGGGQPQATPKHATPKLATSQPDTAGAADSTEGAAKVVSLDAFRKR
ncbi:MAG: ClpXP protease specificity-enhancing factor SspB [Hyphomicrobiaceae bacterium]